MKTLAKWILAGLAFALGVMAAEHCDAYTIRQVRSLNAATSAGAGVGFTTQTNPFYVPGGGMFWQVMVNVIGATRLQFQIEGQMADGTWIVVAGPFGFDNNGGTGGVNPYPLSFSFRGPWQDMRVNMTSRAAGSLTADIYVTY